MGSPLSAGQALERLRSFEVELRGLISLLESPGNDPESLVRAVRSMGACFEGVRGQRNANAASDPALEALLREARERVLRLNAVATGMIQLEIEALAQSFQRAREMRSLLRHQASDRGSGESCDVAG